VDGASSEQPPVRDEEPQENDEGSSGQKDLARQRLKGVPASGASTYLFPAQVAWRGVMPFCRASPHRSSVSAVRVPIATPGILHPRGRGSRYRPLAKHAIGV